jgi:hypothetical protein
MIRDGKNKDKDKDKDNLKYMLRKVFWSATLVTSVILLIATAADR